MIYILLIKIHLILMLYLLNCNLNLCLTNTTSLDKMLIFRVSVVKCSVSQLPT